ncbi:MAG: NB-ARC domain-containing protein [Cyanobacteria bacterium P01_D01_bin.115]
MSNRQRGVVLTDRGQQRLATAIAAAQDDEKDGKRFTQAELAHKTGLSIKTVKKIRSRAQPTDESSLRSFFTAFELELENADFGLPELSESEVPTAAAETAIQPFLAAAKIDWGEKPDTALFFGRTEELETLSHWVMTEQCRVVTLLGMGGIGKTSLAAKLADQIHDQFDYVIWRSLREAPPLDEILVRLIQFLSDQQETEINLPARLGERLIRLLHYLREHRCLLVLYNLESILQAESTGQFRDAYEGYGELIQHIGSTEHQSCLLLTSRECPRELAPMAGDRLPVRLWSVTGIDPAAGREILQTKGLELDETNPQSQELIDRCSGNPQALHLVATAIQREFLGDIDDFLEEEGAAVEDVRTLLDQHLTRLAPLERSILFWLAINREPVGLDELMEDLLPPVTKREVRSALRGLSDRYLIETVGKQFTLQNVIMEFASDRFVEQVKVELQTQQFDLFHTHTLIKATAKDYVRETQVRQFLKPLLLILNDLEEQSIKCLQLFHQHYNWLDGYAPGNFLNLLCQSQVEVCDKDFSAFTLRQVYLKGVKLVNINLARTKLVKAALNQDFSSIQVVEFSPDGQLLATGDRKGCIQLWSLKLKKYLTTFRGHENDIRSLAFSPQGRTLVSGSEDSTIRLWDIEKYQCLHLFKGHRNWVRSVTFSPDGQFIVSGSDDSTIRLWDIQKQQCLHVFKGHTHFVCSVAFSPDGNFLASGSSDSTIRLWDIQKRQCLHTFSGHTHLVWSVVFSPDGNFLASGSSDSTIRLWDIQKRQCFHIFEGYTNRICSVAYSPDRHLFASGSEDFTIRLWDSQKQLHLYTFEGHTDCVRSVAFSPDSQYLASASEDSTIRLWDIQQRKCLFIFQGHHDWVRSVSFSSTGQFLVSGGRDSTIRLWDVQQRKCLHVFTENTNRGWSVVFSPDNQFLVSGTEDSIIRFWDIKKRKCTQTLKGHTDWVRSVAFSPDGRLLVSGSSDSTIRLWDVQQRQCLHVFREHTNRVWSVVFSPDGKTIASGSHDGTIRLWNIHEQRCIYVIEKHSSWNESIAFSPDGKTIATGSADGIIRLWSVLSGRCLAILQIPRPYEGTNITGVQGLTEAQRASMLALGAVDESLG